MQRIATNYAAVVNQSIPQTKLIQFTNTIVEPNMTNAYHNCAEETDYDQIERTNFTAIDVEAIGICHRNTVWEYKRLADDNLPGFIAYSLDSTRKPNGKIKRLVIYQIWVIWQIAKGLSGASYEDIAAKLQQNADKYSFDAFIVAKDRDQLYQRAWRYKQYGTRYKNPNSRRNRQKIDIRPGYFAAFSSPATQQS